AVGGDDQRIFNAHADVLFGNVDAGLDGDHHAGFKADVVVARIVNIEADVMPEPVVEVFAKRLAVQILAVRVDVVVGDLLQRVAVAAQLDPRLDGRDGGFLRAKHDLVNLALAFGELAVHGNRARHIGRVIGAF